MLRETLLEKFLKKDTIIPKHDIRENKKGEKVSSLPNKLNDYWLWKEIRRKLGVSNPLYKYWQDTPNMKLNNKYIFLKKHTLPAKYLHVEENLTDLSGYLPTKYAADALHLNEHVFNYDKMRLHKEFEYRYIEEIKFVNIRKFFTENGIVVPKGAVVHLGKLKELVIDEASVFYNLKNDYGIVIYE